LCCHYLTERKEKKKGKASGYLKLLTTKYPPACKAQSPELLTSAAERRTESSRKTPREATTHPLDVGWAGARTLVLPPLADARLVELAEAGQARQLVSSGILLEADDALLASVLLSGDERQRTGELARQRPGRERGDALGDVSFAIGSRRQVVSTDGTGKFFPGLNLETVSLRCTNHI
jgi:hypothetical protein